MLTGNAAVLARGALARAYAVAGEIPGRTLSISTTTRKGLPPPPHRPLRHIPPDRRRLCYPTATASAGRSSAWGGISPRVSRTWTRKPGREIPPSTGPMAPHGRGRVDSGQASIASSKSPPASTWAAPSSASCGASDRQDGQGLEPAIARLHATSRASPQPHLRTTKSRRRWIFPGGRGVVVETPNRRALRRARRRRALDDRHLRRAGERHPERRRGGSFAHADPRRGCLAGDEEASVSHFITRCRFRCKR